MTSQVQQTQLIFCKLSCPCDLVLIQHSLYYHILRWVALAISYLWNTAHIVRWIALAILFLWQLISCAELLLRSLTYETQHRSYRRWIALAILYLSITVHIQRWVALAILHLSITVHIQRWVALAISNLWNTTHMNSKNRWRLGVVHALICKERNYWWHVESNGSHAGILLLSQFVHWDFV